MFTWPEALDAEITKQMAKNGEVWQCLSCLWTTKYKTRLWEHVEAKHVTSQGYSCPFCSKFCSSKNAWHQHKSKFHKGCWNKLFNCRTWGPDLWENGETWRHLAVPGLFMDDQVQDSSLGTCWSYSCAKSWVQLPLLCQVLPLEESLDKPQEQISQRMLNAHFNKFVFFKI